jgi:hypothetical protein
MFNNQPIEIKNKIVLPMNLLRALCVLGDLCDDMLCRCSRGLAGVDETDQAAVHS